MFEGERGEMGVGDELVGQAGAGEEAGEDVAVARRLGGYPGAWAIEPGGGMAPGSLHGQAGREHAGIGGKADEPA